MKKLLIILTGMLITFAVQGQTYVEISTETPMPICPGFTSSNMAKVEVGPIVSQITPVPNSRIEYIWTVEHMYGTWTWHNYTEERFIPIPWPGTYKIQIKVMYFLQGKTNPYVVFFSNPLFLQGLSTCGGG